MGRGDHWIEITTYDDGQSVWTVCSYRRLHHCAVEQDDPAGDKATAAAEALVARFPNHDPFKRTRRTAPAIRGYGGGRPGDLDLPKFGVILDQLRRGVPVEVSDTPGDDRVIPIYVAHLLESPRPMGSFPPTPTFSAMLSPACAYVLVDSGAKWFGSHGLFPLHHCKDATIESMIDELAAGGTVLLTDVTSPRGGEDIKDAVHDYRNVYRYTHKRAPSVSDPPMHARVTVAEAIDLRSKGAR